jgi:hypothetical protein
MLTLIIITLSIAGLAAGGAGLIASAINSSDDGRFMIDGQ